MTSGPCAGVSREEIAALRRLIDLAEGPHAPNCAHVRQPDKYGCNCGQNGASHELHRLGWGDTIPRLVDELGAAWAAVEASRTAFAPGQVEVHLVLRRGQVVAAHATDVEATEDCQRRAANRPDLADVLSVESWLVQDERNLTDEQHAEAIAGGLIPASRARG